MKPKKRACLAASAVLLAMILLIPIPMTLKDGGTRTYTALTYKVVRWKRLNDTGSGIYRKTRLYLPPLSFLSVDRLWEREMRTQPRLSTELPNPTNCAGEAAAAEHAPASLPQTIDCPISGFCGNTVTRVYTDAGERSFSGSPSTAITAILINLRYEPGNLCDCLPEFTVEIEGKTEPIGVSLSEYYARCGDGQASLTAQQAEIIRTALNQARTDM